MYRFYSTLILDVQASLQLEELSSQSGKSESRNRAALIPVIVSGSPYRAKRELKEERLLSSVARSVEEFASPPAWPTKRGSRRQCPECEYIGRDGCDVQKHFTRMHQPKQPRAYACRPEVYCFDCQHQFRDKSDFGYHLKTKRHREQVGAAKGLESAQPKQQKMPVEELLIEVLQHLLNMLRRK